MRERLVGLSGRLIQEIGFFFRVGSSIRYFIRGRCDDCIFQYVGSRNHDLLVRDFMIEYMYPKEGVYRYRYMDIHEYMNSHSWKVLRLYISICWFVKS